MHVTLHSFFQLHQSIHDDVLHLVCSFLLRLALQTHSLYFYLGVAVLFSIMLPLLLQFVHLSQEQLVLTLEVAIFVLENALDVRVILQIILEHTAMWICRDKLANLIRELGGSLGSTVGSRTVVFLLCLEERLSRCRMTVEGIRDWI